MDANGGMDGFGFAADIDGDSDGDRQDEIMGTDQNQNDDRFSGNGLDDNARKMFSHFDGALGKNWAGPEHWKMRRTIRRVEREREEADAAAADGQA